MNRKKIILILVINLLLLVNIFLIINWLVICKDVYYKEDNPLHAQYSNIEFSDYNADNKLSFSSKKRSIMVLGDSFAAGRGIVPQDTFSYKLQQVTKRKVYCFASEYPDIGVQNILFYLNKNAGNKETIQKNSEYTILVFNANFIDNMYYFVPYKDFYSNEVIETYNQKGDDLILRDEKMHLLDYFKKTFLVQTLNQKRIERIPLEKKLALMKLYIQKINAEIKKQKNNQFVILVYASDRYQSEEKEVYDKFWKEVEAEGIKVIRFDDEKHHYLTDEDYRTVEFEREEPNGRAWDVVVPVVVRDLKL
jgi:hypothetical protein